ncbi:MAG: NHL repeat-containing protein [Betaproteobacteria bacterium]|nr:NHL repeat-containing protein [Betaproteobacteria bacterium]
MPGAATVRATPLYEIRSAMGGADPFASVPAAPAIPGPVSLMRPERIASNGMDLLIADSGLQAVLRTDRAASVMSVVVRLPATRAGGLAVDRLGSIFVSVPAEGTVWQIDRTGRIDRRLQDAAVLASPESVVVDDQGRIFVADALGARVAIFDRTGRVTTVVGPRNGVPDAFRAVSGMALGPAGLHVLDAAARRIVVVDPRGSVIREAGLDPSVKAPAGIAADRWGRIFVGDRAVGGVWAISATSDAATSVEGVSVSAELADLAVDESGTLYVADAAGGVVRTFRLTQPCP